MLHVYYMCSQDLFNGDSLDEKDQGLNPGGSGWTGVLLGPQSLFTHCTHSNTGNIMSLKLL